MLGHLRFAAYAALAVVIRLPAAASASNTAVLLAGRTSASNRSRRSMWAITAAKAESFVVANTLIASLPDGATGSRSLNLTPRHKAARRALALPTVRGRPAWARTRKAAEAGLRLYASTLMHPRHQLGGPRLQIEPGVLVRLGARHSRNPWTKSNTLVGEWPPSRSTVAMIFAVAPLEKPCLRRNVSRSSSLRATMRSRGRVELRAMTGPDYGRIWDYELVEAVMRIAGDGVGDTRWKVPGTLDWATMVHNPFVEVTKDTTTLYASDRDVFLFLVDDTHPIEAGKLPNGDPDLYFRGFYCWNSEVGSKTLGMVTFFLRAVCMNRNIWGAEGFEELSIRHSKFAAHRFAHQAAPALARFADSSPGAFVSGIRASSSASSVLTSSALLDASPC